MKISAKVVGHKLVLTKNGPQLRVKLAGADYRTFKATFQDDPASMRSAYPLGGIVQVDVPTPSTADIGSGVEKVAAAR